MTKNYVVCNDKYFFDSIYLFVLYKFLINVFISFTVPTRNQFCYHQLITMSYIALFYSYNLYKVCWKVLNLTNKRMAYSNETYMLYHIFKQLPISTEKGVKDPLVMEQYSPSFRIFLVRITNLEDQQSKRHLSSTDNQHLNTLIEQNPTSECQRNISGNEFKNFNYITLS